MPNDAMNFLNTQIKDCPQSYLSIVAFDFSLIMWAEEGRGDLSDYDSEVLFRNLIMDKYEGVDTWDFIYKIPNEISAFLSNSYDLVFNRFDQFPDATFREIIDELIASSRDCGNAIHHLENCL